MVAEWEGIEQKRAQYFALAYHGRALPSNPMPHVEEHETKENNKACVIFY